MSGEGLIANDGYAARMQRILMRTLFAARNVPALLPSLRLVEDLRADSLDLVMIAMAAEEEFGINITDDEAAGIVTIGDLDALVASKRGVAA